MLGHEDYSERQTSFKSLERFIQAIRATNIEFPIKLSLENDRDMYMCSMYTTYHSAAYIF